MQSQIKRHTVVFTASCYVALRLTEQALRPSIERVWCKLSSDEALDLYAYVIVFLHDIAILSARLAIAAGRDCRRWADAYVDACLMQPVPAVESLAADPIVEPEDIPAQPEPVIAAAPATPVTRSHKVFPTPTQEVIDQPKHKRSRPGKVAAA